MESAVNSSTSNLTLLDHAQCIRQYGTEISTTASNVILVAANDYEKYAPVMTPRFSALTSDNITLIKGENFDLAIQYDHLLTLANGPLQQLQSFK